ncbi:phosphoribosylanthranilate isomerase [Sporolactobacillus sp. THM7-7]|nr:phosphoribosylanthranilate isomerase [Sporolactobacillus sp. THM7-7]
MHPLLKYCGNRSLADLQVSLAGSADYIGLVFTRRSRRTVRADQVRAWLDHMAVPKDKALVGVFADDPIEMIEDVVKSVPLQVIQLHGKETPRFLKQVKAKTGTTVWKALHHGPDTLRAMRQYHGIADGFVIDTKVRGALGGTGVSFDWKCVPNYTAEAARQRVLCFIAGGITAENIAHLLDYRPDGIDIASGIERNSRKSGELIRKIEEKVRKYDQAAAD